MRLSNGYDAEYLSEYKGMKIYKSSEHLYFVDRGDSHYHGCVTVTGALEFIDRRVKSLTEKKENDLIERCIDAETLSNALKARDDIRKDKERRCMEFLERNPEMRKKVTDWRIKIVRPEESGEDDNATGKTDR